jgi:hypothetical protein
MLPIMVQNEAHCYTIAYRLLLLEHLDPCAAVRPPPPSPPVIMARCLRLSLLVACLAACAFAAHAQSPSGAGGKCSIKPYGQTCLKDMTCQWLAVKFVLLATSTSSA